MERRRDYSHAYWIFEKYEVNYDIDRSMIYLKF